MNFEIKNPEKKFGFSDCWDVGLQGDHREPVGRCGQHILPHLQRRALREDDRVAVGQIAQHAGVFDKGVVLLLSLIHI